LRRFVQGGFSVKLRAGFDDPEELHALLPLFEDCGVDFLIVHARTVAQRYSGAADHRITAAVVRKTGLPVIANGDIFTAETGCRVLAQTGAAGLMLGRGAVADPFLFRRLRGQAPQVPTLEERSMELQQYLAELLSIYQEIFCGEQQVLARIKEVLAYIRDPQWQKTIRRLRKTRSVRRFQELLAGLTDG
jgi:tRNA-dihydrouridine synthase